MRRPLGVAVAASILGIMAVLGLFGVALSFAGMFLMHNPAMQNPALHKGPGGQAALAGTGIVFACFLAFCLCHRPLPSAPMGALLGHCGILSMGLFLVPAYAVRVFTVGNEINRRFVLPPQINLMNSPQLLHLEKLLTMGVVVVSVAISLVFLYALLRCRRWYLGDGLAVDPA